jgi:aldose 1-epimerase
MGHERIALTSTDGSTVAELVPAANLLCSSLRHRGVELLHQGEGVSAYADQGQTMGIPLLYPWANRLAGFDYRAAGKTVTLEPDDPRLPRDPAGLPIHGVLPRLLRWTIDHSSRNGDTLSARPRWTSPELLELYPFLHEVQVDATVRAGELRFATTVRAIDRDAVPVSFDHHRCSRLSAAARQDWRIELGASRRLLLDERLIPTGARTPVARSPFQLADRELDDGFEALASRARFRAAADGTSLSVHFLAGHPFAQVYTRAGRASSASSQ